MKNPVVAYVLSGILSAAVIFIGIGSYNYLSAKADLIKLQTIQEKQFEAILEGHKRNKRESDYLERKEEKLEQRRKEIEEQQAKLDKISEILGPVDDNKEAIIMMVNKLESLARKEKVYKSKISDYKEKINDYAKQFSTLKKFDSCLKYLNRPSKMKNNHNLKILCTY